MGNAKPLDGPLSVTVEALFPIPVSWSRRQYDRALAGAVLPTGRPDVDNILKMLDALNGVVFADDKQITSALVRKRYSNKPALIVKVTLEPAVGRLFDTAETQAA